MPTTGKRKDDTSAAVSVTSGGAPSGHIGEVLPLDLRRAGRLFLEGPLMKELEQGQVGGLSVLTANQVCALFTEVAKRRGLKAAR